jgi:acyl-CoA hydrolase
MQNDSVKFQFISVPSDVNYGGKVHGGEVMKWIDQAGYACATGWAQNYCVTVYVGGIRFYKPIAIGALVKVNAKVIMTGKTSIHIAVDVYSKPLISGKFEKTSHCVIVFVATDEKGNPTPVPSFTPISNEQLEMDEYAKKLVELRKSIDEEMRRFRQ